MLRACSNFEEQTAELEYEPLVAPEDEPAVHLNREKMERFAPLLRPYYYDPSRYDSYLEQLGIEYPTVRQ